MARRARQLAVYLAGRDFGTGLITLVERTKATSIYELQAKLEPLRDKEIKSARDGTTRPRSPHEN